MERTSRLSTLAALGLVVVAVVPFHSSPSAAVPRQSATTAALPLSCTAIEDFLRTAKVGKKRDTPVGVTQPLRATLDDGKMQHDVSIQAIDVSEAAVQTSRGLEANYRDSWKFNVAGYELAKILELNMVPPYVERKIDGQQASLSWWINDTMMERDRDRKKIVAPNVEAWVKQGLAANVFHELIRDTDANKTNILITPDWRMWLIDFTRAFREDKSLLYPKMLVMCDRKLLANLRGLTDVVLKQKLGRWLTKQEIEGVLARRDLIVRFFESEVAAKGQAAVLYDLPQMSEPCGTGLM